MCGAYFFKFRGLNLVCFGIAYSFNGKFAPEEGKARMRTAFFTRVRCIKINARKNHRVKIDTLTNFYQTRLPDRVVTNKHKSSSVFHITIIL